MQKAPKIIAIVLGVVIVILLCILFFVPAKRNSIETREKQNNTSQSSMLITSPSFEPNSAIPKKFTCDGGNMNPELLIQNVPAEAKTLSLIVDDPDAPGGTFVHWVVYNVDPQTLIIKEESVPSGGAEGENGAGKIGFIGPCPPSGTHHYFFKLYALDTTLNFLKAPTKADLEGAMQGHIVAQAELIGLYSR